MRISDGSSDWCSSDPGRDRPRSSWGVKGNGGSEPATTESCTRSTTTCCSSWSWPSGIDGTSTSTGDRARQLPLWCRQRAYRRRLRQGQESQRSTLCKVTALDRRGPDSSGPVRSEERRVGDEWGSTGRSRWSPYYEKK